MASSNSSQPFYVIKSLNVEERPLLDIQDAVKIAALCVTILSFGTLVQVNAMCITTTYKIIQ